MHSLSYSLRVVLFSLQNIVSVFPLIACDVFLQIKTNGYLFRTGQCYEIPGNGDATATGDSNYTVIFGLFMSGKNSIMCGEYQKRKEKLNQVNVNNAHSAFIFLIYLLINQGCRTGSII